MNSWFNFGGVVSTSLGVIVEKFPPLTRPEERVKFETALGKSGSYTLLDGEDVYDDTILPVQCVAKDATKIDLICAWLRGEGRLVLGNMSSRFYDARCVNQLELQQILRGHPHRRFTAMFRCKPYRYLYPPVAAYALTNGGTVNNPGNIFAEPVIVIAGSGNIVVTLGAKAIEITGLAGAGGAGSGSMTIDVPHGAVYRTGTNPPAGLFGNIDYEGWPFTIPPGVIAVGWTGTVSGVTLAPNWRDL